MRNILFIICIAISSATFAQTKKTTTVKKVSVNPVTPANKNATLIKSSADSFSYAIGLQAASFYKTQLPGEVNTALVKRAFDDVYNNKQLLLSQEACNATVQKKQQEAQKQQQQVMSEQSQKEKETGKKFLEENKKRPGVIELPDGLQYEIIKAGTGPKPKATDTVKAHYAGTLIDGKEFDNSYKRNEPITIPVGGVIQGWVEALQLMPVGSKWKLYIPSELGYGDRGAGGAIPGGATLIFEIELLDIVNK
jgi:FKBP-type peptidyl-prolyl cis-trans isomerase FklB